MACNGLFDGLNDLPDLALLGVAAKDELIHECWPLRALGRELMTQVATFQVRILKLEARLAKRSRNSCKPPSSHGLNTHSPKSLRKAGQHPSTPGRGGSLA